MRDSMKMTVKYQFGYILLNQLAAAGIVFLFGAFIFYYFLTINIAKEILSALLIATEFAILYVASKKLANRDAKPVTPLKPSRIKGVLFGVQIAVMNIIMLIIFKLIWANFSDENGLVGILPIAYNMVFYFWTFAYQGFMTGYIGGHIGIIATAAMAIAPIAATTVGYIAGLNRFELAEHLDQFIYEKQEESGEDKE